MVLYWIAPALRLPHFGHFLTAANQQAMTSRGKGAQKKEPLRRKTLLCHAARLSCAARRTRHRILSARANPSYMYQSCSIRITTGNPPCFSSKYSGQHRFPQKLKFPGTPWSVSCRVADHTQHRKRTTSRPSWSFCRRAGRAARGTQPGRH